MLNKIYRPQRFDQIIGQEIPRMVLQKVAQNPVGKPQTYLLSGAWGTGKSTSARIFGRALNCQSNDKPCLKCESCLSFGSDGRYLELDSAMVGNVKDIRNLRESLEYHALPGYKVILFDECLDGNAVIKLADGSSERIRNIVLNKMDVEVLSFNGERFESRRVVGWHRNSPKDVYSYTFKGETKEYRLRASEKHRVLKGSQYVELKDLVEGDRVSIARMIKSKARVRGIKNKGRLYPISKEVDQVILGTLLGDSRLGRKSGKNNTRLIFLQSKKNSSWALLKRDILGDIVLTFKLEKNLGWGDEIWRGQTKSRPELNKYWDLLYRNGRKVVSREYLDLLSPLGIAVWYLDDGSHSKMRYVRKNGECVCRVGAVSLATHSFSREENECIILYFKEKYGIKFKMHRETRGSKGYYINTESVRDASKFLELVAPYIVEGVLDHKITPFCELGQRLAKIEGIKKIEDRDDIKYIREEAQYVGKRWLYNNRPVYDLTVEGLHNYVAADVIVHNCHLISSEGQGALLEITENPPENIFFLFASTDKHKMKKTLLSRSFDLEFFTLTDSEMKRAIERVASQEGISIPDKVEHLIIRRSEGHVRDAVSLIERFSLLGEKEFLDSVVVVDQYLEKMVRSAAEGKKKEVLECIDVIAQAPIMSTTQDISLFIKGILERNYVEGEPVWGFYNESLARKTLQLYVLFFSVLRKSTTDIASFLTLWAKMVSQEHGKPVVKTGLDVDRFKRKN